MTEEQKTFNTLLRVAMYEMNDNIVELQAQVNVIREKQLTLVSMYDAQNSLNEVLVRGIESHSYEFDLVLKRISALWETVMKPTQT